MGVGAAISKGFSVMKQSFNLVLVLFVFGAIWNVVSVFLGPQDPTVVPDVATTVRVIAIGALFVLASIYVQAGSLGFIAAKIKQGKATFAEFTAAGGKFYLRVLLLGLLIALIAGVLILLATLAVSLMQGALSVVGVIVALLLAALGIYLALMFFLAPYAIVADDQKTMAAIKKSMALVKKNILKVLGILLILVAIGFGIGIVLGILFAALSASIPGNTSQIIFGVVSSFVNAVLGVVVTGSFMALYLALSQGSVSNT